MKIIYCPNCDKSTKAIIKKEKEIFKVRGDDIKIDAKVVICQECKTKVFDEQLDSRNLELAYNIYRNKHNILLPNEVRAIREKYGLSQRALSSLLGWGDITIHRYEAGAIQDIAHDNLLRLIAEPEHMRELFEKNYLRLPAYIRTKVEERIDQLLAAEKEPLFQTSFERLVTHKSVDLMSGFREFDLYKFENMVLYLTQRLEGALKTKINKLLWYVDFLNFKEFSVSITGSRYVHLPFGPIPDNYELIFANMIHENLLEVNEVIFDAEDDIVGENLVALTDSDESAFEEDEIQVMNYIAATFRDFGSAKITRKSHQEVGYRETTDNEAISYEYAKQLSISLPKNEIS